MNTDVVQTVAHYAEEALGEEGFRYVSTVVANCKMLTLELEAQEENPVSVDMDVLVIAAYLHDIATITHGFDDHPHRSAEMALAFLRELGIRAEELHKIEQAILVHTTTDPAVRNFAPIEGLILYDADKLGRLSGLAVVTSLIEFGARYPNRVVTSDVLAVILRHIEERFIELYQSLNTQPARDMAREKFHRTLAFLDGVIEHLSDATPI